MDRPKNESTGKFETIFRDKDIKEWMDQGMTQEQILGHIVTLGGRNLPHYRIRIKDVFDKNK